MSATLTPGGVASLRQKGGVDGQAIALQVRCRLFCAAVPRRPSMVWFIVRIAG